MITKSEMESALRVQGSTWFCITSFGDGRDPETWDIARFIYRGAEWTLSPHSCDEGLLCLTPTFLTGVYRTVQAAHIGHDLDHEVRSLVAALPGTYRLDPAPRRLFERCPGCGAGVAEMHARECAVFRDRLAGVPVKDRFAEGDGSPAMSMRPLRDADQIAIALVRIEPPRGCESCGNVMLRSERYTCGFCGHVHPMVRRAR